MSIELLFNELERAMMCSEDFSYNEVSKSESSITYQRKIEKLYSNAVSDLYGLNESQRRIVIRRINEVRERQMCFDIPSTDTINAMLRDYNSQPEGKRNKSLLDDYRYCKFVLECVAIQREYLAKFTSLVNAEVIQDAATDFKEISNIDEDTNWLSVEETASKFRLPLNNIKSRQWRINNDFPYKGYDETKGAYNKVIFNINDVEDWIQNHKKK